MENTNHVNWEFETIAKHTLDILLIVDKNQIVKFATPSLESILGYRSEEFVGTNAFDLVYHEDRDKLMASHREAAMTKESKADEYRVFHKNGELKYFESRVTPIPNHPDNLVVVSIRDITFRKRMELELENRRNRYQELQNQLKHYSQDLSSVRKIVDLQTRLIKELTTVIPDSNPKVVIYNRETLKFEGDFPTGLPSYLPLLSVGKLQFDHKQIHILIGDHKEKAYILSIRASSIKETMDSIWFETLVHYTIMVFESLTIIESLMVQLDTALQKVERPQWIIKLLFHLSEKQRMELSSDLHDTVLQNQMSLFNSLETMLKNQQLDDEMTLQLKGILQGLMDTIHQIRVTCHELRPPLLKELGLIRALENLFHDTQDSSAFNITFTTENMEGFTINEEATIGIYRIVQELLNNATKHSQAANLHFHIYRLDETLHLTYTDDGIGLDAGYLTPSFNSMGLSGMRERIRSLNGTIGYYSQPGNGLRITLQIPLHV